MKLDIYTDAHIFEQLKPEWNELLQRSTNDTVFSTWEWLSTWWGAYYPGQLWLVTVRGSDDRLVGIAPWFIDDQQVIRAIGCVDVTDYIDVIVDKNCTNEVYGCLVQCLHDQQSCFRALNLCNIPASSPTLSEFARHLANCNFIVTKEPVDVCPVIVLPETWDDYLANLNKKQRHEVRRKLRRAHAANEEVATYTVDGTYDLQQEMAEFMQLMAASDSAKAAFLDDARNRQFFETLIPLMHQNGWLSLNFLTVNGEPTAAYLNFDYNDQILVYNSGLRYEPHGHLSPGILLLVENIQSAIEKKYRVFDFLRGDEVYKYRMGGTDTEIYRLIASKDMQ